MNTKFKLTFLIFAITELLLLGCREKCKEERASNYKERHECSFSYVDNWIEEIIIDSILINGIAVKLENESWYYHSEGPPCPAGDQPDCFYESAKGGSNSYSADVNLEEDVYSDINTIKIKFRVPIGDDFEIDNITNSYLICYFRNDTTYDIDTTVVDDPDYVDEPVYFYDSIMKIDHEYFRKNDIPNNQNEITEVGGIRYISFEINVVDIESEVKISRNGFKYFRTEFGINYEDLFYVNYEIRIDELE